MRNTVAGKLTILITVLLIAIFSGAAILNLYIQERAATRILRLNGAQIADMVVGATRSAMLLNDREQIQRTIDKFIEPGDVRAHELLPTQTELKKQPVRHHLL